MVSSLLSNLHTVYHPHDLHALRETGPFGMGFLDLALGASADSELALLLHLGPTRYLGV